MSGWVSFLTLKNGKRQTKSRDVGNVPPIRTDEQLGAVTREQMSVYDAVCIGSSSKTKIGSVSRREIADRCELPGDVIDQHLACLIENGSISVERSNEGDLRFVANKGRVAY